MLKGQVLSVNISEKKGEIKLPVSEIEINEKGIKNDAHSGNWHRQISLLDRLSISEFEKEFGRKLEFGEFAENITTEGFVLYKMNLLDILQINDIVLEVTQIGKKCHGGGCAIYNAVGKCVMPKEGIFCRVKTYGKIRPGDSIVYIPKIYKAKVITLSDRASEGVYEDLSGPAVKNILENYFSEKNQQIDIDSIIISDNKDILKKEIQTSISEKYDFIITTGGTGLGERDITIETIKPLLDKEIPGVMESIRVKYGAEKPNALLSRSIAGLVNKTLVYALPGSVKAVNEYMQEINKTLLHSIYMINGLDNH
jgi:molybdopterin adenylyltransferase